MDDFETKLSSACETRASFVKAYLEVGITPEETQSSLAKGDFAHCEPKVLCQVPASCNLPESLPLVQDESEPRTNSLYNFVLTDDQGKELYGTCYRFYDRCEGTAVKWDAAHIMQPLNGFSTSRVDHRPFMTMGSPKSTSIAEEASFEYFSKHPSIPQNTKSDPPLFASPGFATMVPRCIVLVTSDPFLETSKALLLALYCSMKNAPLLPLECHVLYLLLSLPAPCSQVELKFELGETKFAMSLPPRNRLPLMDVNMGTLFASLELSNVLKVFRAVLLERNVVFLSSSEEKLTDCAMSVLGLLYPFKWRLIFVPVLPTLWIDYMSSPVSFVMGALSDCEDEVLARCAGEELIVDLDANTVRTACSLHLSQYAQPIADFPDLPDHYGKKLVAELTKVLISESGCKLRPIKLREPRIKPESASKVRESFFKFFVSVLKNYKDFLNYEGSSQEDPGSLFNKSGFVESCSENSAKVFLSGLLETQMFANFCESRIRTTTVEQHYENLLFDEHIAAKKNRSKLRYSKVKTPFIDDKTSDSKTAFQVPPIQAAFGRSPELQSYARFPGFDVQRAEEVGLPRTAVPVAFRVQEEQSPRLPLSPFPVFEAPRRQGLPCVFCTWLQMWARTLRCQHPSEHKARLTELLSVFESMQKRNCRPSPSDYKLVLDACLKVDSSLALPIFTFMSRNNVMVDGETLSILHKSVSRRSKCVGPLIAVKGNGEVRPRVFTRAKDTRVFAKKEVRFFIREHCMQCGDEFLVSDVMRLWQSESDMEIECKACRRAFAPDLQVRVGLEIGSPGNGLGRTSTVEGVALYSPFQLRGKADTLSPVEDLMPLRTYENALFWNLVWYFHYYELPYEFLLPYETQSPEPIYHISVADESPKTAVEPFAPEASRFSQVIRALREDAETQTEIRLIDPL